MEMNFDGLNMYYQSEILSISEYFDGMDLTEIEKKKRKAFAEDFLDAMLFIFSLFSIMIKYRYLNKQYIISQLEIRYSEIVLQYMNIDKTIEKYIQEFSVELVDTTIKHSDEEYYLSDDRAFIVSTNEANSIMGYREFQEAKEKGYTKKTWVTEKDDKVRKTHREVNGETIDIDRLFLVGKSLMAYPHDFTAEPEEVCGCRCTLKYS